MTTKCGSPAVREDYMLITAYFCKITLSSVKYEYVNKDKNALPPKCVTVSGSESENVCVHVLICVCMYVLPYPYKYTLIYVSICII